jgi:hypothetical protein
MKNRNLCKKIGHFKGILAKMKNKRAMMALKSLTCIRVPTKKRNQNSLTFP